MIILNESKIKYEKLDELLEEQLLDIRYSQQVNVIVDLKEVIKKFFRPDVMLNLNKKLAKEEISSDIINLVGHYRNYFYKKGKYTSFFFLYSYSECKEMKKIFPNYKKEYYSKYFNSEENKEKTEIISSVMKVVNKIINILPNCHFIDTSDFDELVFGKYIIEELTKSNELNIILSNDPVMYQLLNKNTFILNLKGINSQLLTSKNVVSVFSKRDTEISSNLIPLLLSIAGDKKYTLEGIPNVAIKKGITILEKLIERKILTDTNSIEFPIEVSSLNPNNKLDRQIIENFEDLKFNYSLIRGDSLYYTHKSILLTKFSKSVHRGVKSYLLEFNSKVFTTFPLNLDMIVKGETLL